MPIGSDDEDGRYPDDRPHDEIIKQDLERKWRSLTEGVDFGPAERTTMLDGNSLTEYNTMRQNFLELNYTRIIQYLYFQSVVLKTEIHWPEFDQIQEDEAWEWRRSIIAYKTNYNSFLIDVLQRYMEYALQKIFPDAIWGMGKTEVITVNMNPIHIEACLLLPQSDHRFTMHILSSLSCLQGSPENYFFRSYLDPERYENAMQLMISETDASIFPGVEFIRMTSWIRDRVPYYRYSSAPLRSKLKLIHDRLERLERNLLIQ